MAAGGDTTEGVLTAPIAGVDAFFIIDGNNVSSGDIGTGADSTLRNAAKPPCCPKGNPASPPLGAVVAAPVSYTHLTLPTILRV